MFTGAEGLEGGEIVQDEALGPSVGELGIVVVPEGTFDLGKLGHDERGGGAEAGDLVETGQGLAVAGLEGGGREGGILLDLLFQRIYFLLAIRRFHPVKIRSRPVFFNVVKRL